MQKTKVIISSMTYEESKRIAINIGINSILDFEHIPVGYIDRGIRRELLGVNSKDKVFLGYFTIEEMKYIYSHDKKPNFIGRLKLAIKVLRGKYLKVI